MQAQQTNVESNTTAFKVGDAVSYVTARNTARSISFSVREGKIVEINGGVAVVKSRHGISIQLLEKLTRQGERNALTRALLGDAQ